MKEKFADYIVVNANNYSILNTTTFKHLNMCEIKCFPYNLDKPLNVGYSDDIDKYLFSAILPHKMDKHALIGARVLCKVDEFGQMDICEDSKIDYEFYERCKNLARFIEDYGKISVTQKDNDIILHISKLLHKMLADKLRFIFARQNNLTLCYLGEQSIKKMYTTILTRQNLVTMVNGIKEIELELQKPNNEFKKSRHDNEQTR